MIGYIYQLICPKTMMPFYVGSTLSSLEKRLNNHMSKIKGNRTQFVYQYIRDNNITPVMDLIKKVEVIDRKHLIRIERDKILELKSMGYNLTNKFYFKEAMVHSTIKIHPDIWDRMEKALSDGLYPSRNNLINVALANELKEKK